MIIGKTLKVTKFSSIPPQGTKVTEGTYVEVRGLLSSDGSLQFHGLTSFGADADINQYAEMVKYYNIFCK